MANKAVVERLYGPQLLSEVCHASIQTLLEVYSTHESILFCTAVHLCQSEYIAQYLRVSKMYPKKMQKVNEIGRAHV